MGIVAVRSREQADGIKLVAVRGVWGVVWAVVRSEVLGIVFSSFVVCFFFFQAEDGIRDVAVTGVQTCALPILYRFAALRASSLGAGGCKTAFTKTSRAASCSVSSSESLIASAAACWALATTNSVTEEPRKAAARVRSEEHTSELQSRLHLVCRL